MKNLSILYLGNFDSPNAEYISKSFEELGHKVKRRHEEFIAVPEVLSMIKDYDFVLTEEARLKDDYIYGEITRDEPDKCLGGMKKVMDKILVIPWLTNIQWGMPRREKMIYENPIYKAPIVFTTDGGHDKEWKEAGVNHKLLRQGIYQGEAVMVKPEHNTGAEIGFVGENNKIFWSYRGELFNFLMKEYGRNFEWVGQGSNHGQCYRLELNGFCAKIKIMIGDSVFSPKYWSNRVYEMIGRGAFLIMPRIEGLDAEFEPLKHYVEYEYNNFEDLKNKIDYYLKNSEEREKIRQQGFEYCKANHTYKDRVKTILNYARHS